MTEGTITGAQALVRSLEQVGVDVVFGIPGGASFSSAGLQNLFTSISTITNNYGRNRFSINPNNFRVPSPKNFCRTRWDAGSSITTGRRCAKSFAMRRPAITTGRRSLWAWLRVRLF